MFDRILVAVGGPDASFEPARVAARLAASSGAQLALVSVFRSPSQVFGDPNYEDRLFPRLAEAEAALKQARDIALAEGARDVEIDTLEGSPADAIVAHAMAGNYDLIVMGTHRRGRFGVALLGSVSNSVAARAGRPVMVVPEPASSSSNAS